MAYDPMAGFQVGQAIGKSKGSAYGKTASHMSDLTKERDKSRTKTSPLEVALLKSTLDAPLKESQIALNEAKTNKMEDPSSHLSVSQQIAKDKRTEALIDMKNNNQLRREYIKKAKTSLPNLPGGIAGKLGIGIMRKVNPDNPILADWQNLKSVLMDSTLMKIGKTKGAISDREMEAFQTAAANDDLISVSRMGTELDKLMNAIDAQEKSAKETYMQLYKEDPNTFLGSMETEGAETGGIDIKSKYAKALSQYPSKRKSILAKYKAETGEDYA